MQENWTKALAEAKAERRHPVHSFHRYFGKLIPAIPRFAIREFTSPGESVIDTFAGSGTTLVEASQLGRASTGVDLNPLATFISRVKTTKIDADKLEQALLDVIARKRELSATSSALPEPYVVNMDHWFRPEVKHELISLKEAINCVAEETVRNFYLGCFSAFIRNVSNADPQHVFPGYSKRMRQLDLEGRSINVESSFHRASKKRILQVASLNPQRAPVDLVNSRAQDHVTDTAKYKLAVINPPYISSIRYLETMKIEMGWLGYIESKSDYLALDKRVTGTERYYRDEVRQFPQSGISQLDEQISQVGLLEPKMAKVIAEYFADMRQALLALAMALAKDGILVMKISESRVRGQLLATPRYLTQIAAEFGFDLLDDIVDEISSNSRSLLTARNSYSGMITRDHVLVLQRTT